MPNNNSSNNASDNSSNSTLNSASNNQGQANEALSSDIQSTESIKAVAIYEIAKGVGASLAAIAILIWHGEIATKVAQVSQGWHTQGGWLSQPIDTLLKMAEQASKHWQLAIVLIAIYVSLRFIEAYGLWTDKTWAYWFSVIGYGVFIPLELYYLFARSFDWFHLVIFLLNVLIVWVVYRNMKSKGLI